MKTPTKTPLTIITFDDSVSPLTMDDNMLTNPKDWIHFDEGVHASTPASRLLSKSTDFCWTDYDENPFSFSLFGRSPTGLKAKAYIRDVFAKKTQGSGRFNDPDEPSSMNTTVEVERIRLRRLYYIALVKLSLKLGIAAKTIEFATVGVMGIRYAMGAWLSLALQLVLTSLASITQLWRYNGKFSLPEETFDKDLYKRAESREKRCCIIHGLWKICSAAALISFSIRTFVAGGVISEDDLPRFQRMIYLGAGFCTGGFVSRISLNVWVTYITSRGLGTAHSLSAESIFSYIVAVASLKIGLLCFVLMWKPEDLNLIRKVQELNAYIDLVLGAVSIGFAGMDLIRSRRH